MFNGIALADTRRAKRVLETSHPPSYYIPPEDIKLDYLVKTERKSFCEWKEVAGYADVVVGDQRVPNAAWYYPRPTPEFSSIQHYLSFYASKMDACYVDNELVQSQPGDFYGGWITTDIVGLFKGGAGTMG